MTRTPDAPSGGRRLSMACGHMRRPRVAQPPSHPLRYLKQTPLGERTATLYPSSRSSPHAGSPRDRRIYLLSCVFNLLPSVFYLLSSILYLLSSICYLLSSLVSLLSSLLSPISYLLSCVLYLFSSLCYPLSPIFDKINNSHKAFDKPQCYKYSQ